MQLNQADQLASQISEAKLPTNEITGETKLHQLAREGQVKILKFFLQNKLVRSDEDETKTTEDKKRKNAKLIVSNILVKDNLGWNPIMSAIKAEKGSREVIEMFLLFLLEHMENPNDLSKLLNEDKEIMEKKAKVENRKQYGKPSKETLFTLLMSNESKKDISKGLGLLCQLLKKHSNENQLSNWFHVLTKQLWKAKTCDCTSQSMKELIRLASEVETDFTSVMMKQNKFGNTLLMKLAMKLKDEALRELFTNPVSSKHVSYYS